MSYENILKTSLRDMRLITEAILRRHNLYVNCKPYQEDTWSPSSSGVGGANDGNVTGGSDPVNGSDSVAVNEDGGGDNMESGGDGGRDNGVDDNVRGGGDSGGGKGGGNGACGSGGDSIGGGEDDSIEGSGGDDSIKGSKISNEKEILLAIIK
ncbi:circumsporozoite protein-like [Papaver somniferum]|uniref:circumsporozoite protein-like n=1 Tax=Papaver somniferum TaxID=3469 RepID=UPI000E6F7628|nr:circumsporozoite protein-like [Papaver somniferum]